MNRYYWSDGIHWVKPTPKRTSDAERWPWRVGSHRESKSTYKRKALTMDEAIVLGKEATKLWLKNHPEEKDLTNPGLLPQASALKGKRKGVRRQPAQKVPPFSTYHFRCISANPVAQVWMCNTLPGEIGNVGRRAKGGKTNKQKPFNHTKGECAVMLWKEPVRNPDGSVRVFARMEAEHFAIDAYYQTPEDECLFWEEGHKVVHRTRHVDVIFDPECNGLKEPFSLWVHPPGGDPKPVYEGYRKKAYTKSPGKLLGGGSIMASTPDEAAAIAFNKKLASMATEEALELSSHPVTFPSIWGAEQHAENVTEATLRGENVLLRLG